MENKEPIVIVEYSNSYKDQVISLVGECLVDQSVLSKSCLPLDDDDLQKIPELYGGRGKFWLALDRNQVVGTVGVLEIKESRAKLKRMFVKKELRGTGLGKRLLDTALQFAVNTGYTTIFLNTHKNMERAHNFYKKNGFILIGKKGEDALTFEKVL